MEFATEPAVPGKSKQEKKMFTLKFEVDELCSGDTGSSFVICAQSYRVRRQKDGSADIMIANENGAEIAHPVGNGIGEYQRCYVMNPAGATVDKITPNLGTRASTLAAA